MMHDTSSPGNNSLPSYCELSGQFNSRSHGRLMCAVNRHIPVLIAIYLRYRLRKPIMIPSPTEPTVDSAGAPPSSPTSSSDSPPTCPQHISRPTPVRNRRTDVFPSLSPSDTARDVESNDATMCAPEDSVAAQR